jgi:hypothetical protein
MPRLMRASVVERVSVGEKAKKSAEPAGCIPRNVGVLFRSGDPKHMLEEIFQTSWNSCTE